MRHCICILGPLLAFIIFFVYVPWKAAVSYSNFDAVQLFEESERVKYKGPIPGAETSDLAVFLHISDLHISKFIVEYEQHLKAFVNDVVPAVDPILVLATGDLTDGYKNENHVGGEQQVIEWKTYRKILNESGMLSRPNFWVDVRGNHDSYGTGVDEDISTNLYETYGVSSALNTGRSNKRAWKHEISVGSSTYRFVFFDATVTFGLMDPFNFFGYLSDTITNAVTELLEGDSENITMNILAGHHPLSQIWGGFESGIVDKCAYYLCGHLHSAEMKMRKGSMLELEVDDLKSSSGFRLVALDHGVFSFSEEYLDTAFPMGLITNPKDARYLSTLEPFHTSASTHVRILAIPKANTTIESVKVHFNRNESHPLAGDAQPIGQNMFALPWSPADHFDNGLQLIHVSIVDSSGTSRYIDQQFSIDGTTASMGVSLLQVEQAVGNTPGGFRALLGGEIAVNLMMLIFHHRTLLPGIFGDSPSKTEVCFTWYLLVSVLLLSFGPMFIGFFAGNGPVCFVFPFGIAVLGNGMVTDGMAITMGCLVHGMVVFPFLSFLSYFDRTKPSLSEVLATPFETKGMLLERPGTRSFRWYQHNFLLFANVLMLFLFPVWLKVNFFFQTLPLFISPALLVLYGNAMWSIRLSRAAIFDIKVIDVVSIQTAPPSNINEAL